MSGSMVYSNSKVYKGCCEPPHGYGSIAANAGDIWKCDTCGSYFVLVWPLSAGKRWKRVRGFRKLYYKKKGYI